MIVGGFGVGKTTMVRSVSEIRPLTTEETMTQAGVGVDDNSGVESKTATTVAMDFGRISISEQLVLYLFGTPARNASGSCGTASSRARSAPSCWSTPMRLEVSFDVIGRLEERGVPFIVAINTFPDAPRHRLEALRAALDLPDEIPIVDCDARQRASSRDTLMALMRYLHSLAMRRAQTS